MANPLLSPLFNPKNVCVTIIYVDGNQTVTRRKETTIVRNQCTSACLQHCHYPSFKQTKSFVIHPAGKHAKCNLPAYPNPQMFLHMVLYYTGNYYVLQNMLSHNLLSKRLINFVIFLFHSGNKSHSVVIIFITSVTHQRRPCPTKA